MSIYHCSIKIISRAGGRSAVASAAYRAGEKLHNEETGLTHDFRRKNGVVMNEILLPGSAPAKYMDRETLWNEVQQVEARSDARFAREVEVAFPIEMTREQQIECVRGYIRENFISKGMIADWALHDKGDGNPHAHIMLTCRPFNDKQEWDTKMKSVFANDRDSEGRPIFNPDKPSYDPKDKEGTKQYRIPVLDKNGNQKFRERKGKGKEMLWERINIPTNDWNSREYAELWRASWAKWCNRYLEPEAQIDHRSYKRQGIDKEPMIHEGVIARKMEAKGKTSDRCSINREIKEYNSLRKKLRKNAEEIVNWIVKKARDILGRYKGIEGITRSTGNLRKGRKNDIDHNATKRSNQRVNGAGKAIKGRKPESRERAGRTSRIKRDIDSSKQQIERTDRFVTETDREVEELIAWFKEEELKINARYKRVLGERADGSSDRALAGREQGKGQQNSRTAGKTGAERSSVRGIAETIEEYREFLGGPRR